MTYDLSFQNMNWADYAIVIIIFFSLIISLARGFIREVFSVVIWVVAFWIGFTFSGAGADMLKPYIDTPSLRLIIAFSVLFVVTLIVGGMISHLIARLVHTTGLSGTDRTLGIIFGILRGILLVTVIILLASLTSIPKDPWWQQSQLIPYFQPLVTWLQRFLPEHLNNTMSALNLHLGVR